MMYRFMLVGIILAAAIQKEAWIDGNEAEALEIRVLESDTRNLTLFHRSDLVFAVLYSFLVVQGLILTLISL